MSKSNHDLFFSMYPLTENFKLKLDSIFISEKKFIELAFIRKKGVFGALSFFYKQECSNFIIVSETEDGKSLVSVLKCFAILAKSQKIFELSPDLNLIQISKLKIVLSIFKILIATLHGFFVMMYALIDINIYNRNKGEKFALKGESILYLNMNLWFGIKVGGSVGHIAGVINEFSKIGFNVNYAAISDSLIINNSVKRIILKSPNIFGLPPEINSYRFEFMNYIKMKQLCVNTKPAFIYQRLSVSSYLGAKLANKYKIPLLVEYNGSEVWTARNWGRPLLFEKLALKAEDMMLKNASRIITISKVLYDELVERGVSPDKIIFYPNCIDASIFDPSKFSVQQINELKISYNFLSNQMLITFLGTFGQWHGVDIFAKSIVQLVSKNKTFLDINKIKFLFIGDGLKMPIVKEILQSYNAIDYCYFTGLVEQEKAPLYLASSSILISPHVKNPDGTKFFGSPTKLFEYLAMGKVIIASDLDQIGDVLSNSIRFGIKESDDEIVNFKRVAYLVEPGNVSDLSNAILEVVERPFLASVLGKNARELALEKYTWEKHVKAILH